MSITGNRLYLLILSACFLGSIYLFLDKYFIQNHADITFCLFKNVFGIPCPSCGTTRAIELLLSGNLIGSLQLNPFGVLVFAVMILAPVWISIDLLFSKDRFLKAYSVIERQFRNYRIAIPAIGIVLLNWIWNLYKGN